MKKAALYGIIIYLICVIIMLSHLWFNYLMSDKNIVTRECLGFVAGTMVLIYLPIKIIVTFNLYKRKPKEEKL